MVAEGHAPAPYRPRSPRNTYGVRTGPLVRSKSCVPIGAKVVGTCPRAVQLRFTQPALRPKYGVDLLQERFLTPDVPPSNKPFVEQDLEKLRNTTAGVAWKADDKEYLRKRARRPTYSFENQEYRIMYEFFIDLFEYARANKHVLQMDRGWDDTRTAVNTKLHFIQMSDEDIQEKAYDVVFHLDQVTGYSRLEEVLFCTEMEWREMHLPINLGLCKTRLLRFMSNHKKIHGLHRATFWAAQQSTQRVVDRGRSLTFAGFERGKFVPPQSCTGRPRTPEKFVPGGCVGGWATL